MSGRQIVGEPVAVGQPPRVCAVAPATGRGRGRTLATALLAAACLLGAPVLALGDASPSQVIGALNALREQNGIPGGIVENAEWSQGCALHNRYQALNDGDLTHDEVPGRPGYTELGAQAGGSSVLSSGSWSEGTVFARAPIHLAQILAPQLAVTGVADANGYVCMSTFRGYDHARFAQDGLFSFPGDGRQDVPIAEVASERPFVPGDLVGLPQGTRTGPHLYVFAAGPSADFLRISEAILDGPEGPIEVRHVDNGSERIAGFLPPGGIVIPVRRLEPATTYRARVSMSGARPPDDLFADGLHAPAPPPTPVAITREWTFRTAAIRVPTPERIARQRLPLDANGLLFNQRTSQSALALAAELEARFEGTTVRQPRPSRGTRRIAVSASQLRTNQRIAQAALRRVNALIARLEGRRPAPARAAPPRRAPLELTRAQLATNQLIADTAWARALAAQRAMSEAGL